MKVLIDLHIHSCLSPCASLEMSPAAIVRRARRAGLRAIALTDHNSARNHPPFERLCRAAGILPVFGIEVNTREEAHVLALFGDSGAAADLGEEIYRLLPDYANDPLTLGDQVYVNEYEEILGTVDRYLGNTADIGLEELGERVLSRGGMFIPSHIDRPFFSVVSQLGFLPDLPYTAVELVDRSNRHLAVAGGRRVPALYTSDSHHPDDIGKRSSAVEIGPFLTAPGRPSGGGTSAGVSFSAIRAALEAGKAVYHRS